MLKIGLLAFLQPSTQHRQGPSFPAQYSWPWPASWFKHAGVTWDGHGVECCQAQRKGGGTSRLSGVWSISRIQAYSQGSKPMSLRLRQTIAGRPSRHSNQSLACLAIGNEAFVVSRCVFCIGNADPLGLYFVYERSAAK